MGRRGVNLWDWITGVVGLLLILSLFLKWYTSNGDPRTGWQSLALVDKIVLLCGLLAIALPIVAWMRQTPADTQRYVVLVAGFALFTAIVIALRIVNPPELQQSKFKTDVMAGAWVGLVLAALTIACALVAGRVRVGRRAASVS